jgi:hypothetical protein
VAAAQLTKMDLTILMSLGCSIARRSGPIVGKGRSGSYEYELDFLDAIRYNYLPECFMFAYYAKKLS